MHPVQVFIVVSLILVLISSVSGDSPLQTPDDWKKTRLGSFSTLSQDEVNAVITPVLVNGTYHDMVVVLVDPSGYVVYGYGRPDLTSRPIPDEHALMGLGSISKVFTGILAADAEERALVNLTVPITRYLPGIQVPSLNGREITLIDLATHTSGLPAVPDTFGNAADSALIAGDFDAYEDAFAYHTTMQDEEVYSWLSNLTLTREPGSAWEYSNVGTGIAGDIISRVNNERYEAILSSRVLQPLSMNNTTIVLSGPIQDQIVPGYRGYSGEKDPARLIEFNDFWASSGGIYSTGEDMAVFMAANLGLVNTTLDSSMKNARIPRYTRATEPILQEQSLFWDVLNIPNVSVMYTKSGETNGYQSHIILDPANKRGALVLADTAYLVGPHVQDQATELMKKMTA